MRTAPLFLFHNILALHVSDLPLYLLNLLLFVELVENYLLVLITLFLVLFHIDLVALLQFIQADVAVTVELGV